MNVKMTGLFQHISGIPLGDMCNLSSYTDHKQRSLFYKSGKTQIIFKIHATKHFYLFCVLAAS